MKQIILILLIALSICNSYSLADVKVNYDINTDVFKVEEPLNVWLKFLDTKDDESGSKYWNSEEVEKYGNDSYFILENELNFGNDNFLQMLGYMNISVIRVNKVSDYFKITSIASFASKKDTSNINYIFYVYAKKIDGEFKLFNALKVNSELLLESEKIDFITYYYPKSHEFDLDLAQKQNQLIKEISDGMGIPLEEYKYYFANSREEIMNIKGLYFIIGNSGNEIPSGIADVQNSITFSSGLDEYYPHELIHLLINPKFPDTHNWILEGFATYFGMSRGIKLETHINKLSDHLKQNSSIDLNSMLELKSLDQYTDYRYVLGGYIIQKAFEKSGFDYLNQILSKTKSDDDFYKTVAEVLGVERDEINSFIRKDLLVKNK
jgi:hypothetical protein